MRNLITLLTLCLFVMFASCSSTQVDNSKLKLAKEAGHALEGALDSLYEKELEAEFYQVKSCDLEAFQYGEDLREKMEEVLKVKQDDKQKSMIVDSLCMIAVSQALPMVIESSDLARPCLTKLGSVSAVKLGKSVCENIADD